MEPGIRAKIFLFDAGTYEMYDWWQLNLTNKNHCMERLSIEYLAWFAEFSVGCAQSKAPGRAYSVFTNDYQYPRLAKCKVKLIFELMHWQ